MHIFYYISIIILSGIVLAYFARKLNLPNVTGYLVAGLIIGPNVSRIVPASKVLELYLISDFALGFIAYSIGSALNIKRIRKTGNGVMKIALFESLGAVVIVSLFTMIIFRQSLAFSMVLGSIAATTAPAATMMVVRQYNARGKLVDTLFPVIAIDNSLGIILFSIASALATPLMITNGSHVAFQIFISFKEIIISIIIGFIIGVVLSFLFDRLSKKDDFLSITIAFICLAIAIAYFLSISSMMLCLMIGATVTNLSVNNVRALSALERFTPPLFILFFVIASLKLDMTVFKQVGFIVIGYIILRSAGKILGSGWGAKIVKAPVEIQKYLGYTLTPQAGVAIGLSLLAEAKIPGFGSDIRAIIVASTIVYELAGPIVAKIALTKAGQIT
ncbi:UNVERIFIED_CONTAM: Kef-type K+ transport system membrane component KefB [Acetivibrio alkalicellulosi]